jgi:hypothetical protein
MSTTVVISTIAAGAIAYGAFKVHTFMKSVSDFKEQAKSDHIQAPSGFLKVGGSDTSKSFFRINDAVMGGKSSSQLSLAEEGFKFEGIINTNGGGFASFRSLGDEEKLGVPADAQYVVIDATGDGLLYKSSLHTADSWSMFTPTFSHDFKTRTGQREFHRLPLSNFVGSRQGQPVKNTILDPTTLTGVGFGLSLYTMDGKPHSKDSGDFGDGPFRLEVHTMRIE